MAVYEFIVASYRIEKSVSRTREGALESLYVRLKTGEKIIVNREEEKLLLSTWDKLKGEEGKEDGR